MSKLCDICGSIFEPNVYNQLRCGDICVKVAHARYEVEARKKRPKKTRESICRVCGKTMVLSGKSNLKFCPEACKKIADKERFKKYRSQGKYKEIGRKFARSEKRKAWQKKWYSKNKLSLLAKDSLKAKTNPEFRLYRVLRATMHRCLNLKKGLVRTKFLPYNTKQLKDSLESKFLTGMSWENYGRSGWHIDHVKPLTAFNFVSENGNVKMEEVISAMSLENLQPLWAADNISKSNRY